MTHTNKDNLWLLTEERPKKEVIKKIVEQVCSDKKFRANFSNLKIKPILDKSLFTFVYEVIGINIAQVGHIYIKIVSGHGSFVDYLVFLQENEPVFVDSPVYAIEETKTDDSESRNTGAYQRGTKFVYVDFYYPHCKKIMLYNLKVKPKKPTQTSIFGTRMLLTLDVQILGKELDPKIFKKFRAVDELIQFKRDMRSAPKGNVPISILKDSASIKISGRLWKAGGLHHDPNIGALSLISATLRRLKWNKKIVITRHGLSQNELTERNKFIQIANEKRIELEGLVLPETSLPDDYWHYEQNSEKVATIFLHLILEELPDVKSIYENHAGCERGYFYGAENELFVLHKYVDNVKSKGKIPKLPDLIILNARDKEILILEGKTNLSLDQGLEEIKKFGIVENEYVRAHYAGYAMRRGLIIFDLNGTPIDAKEVFFILNSKGQMLTSKNTPDVIIRALKNLILNPDKK